MKKLLLSILLLVVVFLKVGLAQYYSTGQDRASIKWKEINTTEFQIVYPDYFEKEAQRLANSLTVLYECNSESMEIKPKKVSILLHTESTKSNGYVVWAPRRSEMYTTAPDVCSGDDWLVHLTTHEYRHVVQMDKLNESLPKLLTSIFGEQIVPFVLAYKVPMWFMEGDAVLTESLMSKVGRGRSADFMQVMKAYLVENDNWYKYDKAAMGSFKDFVPSIYHLGYPMVANTRKHYGKEVWNDALVDAGKKPYLWHNFLQKNLMQEKRKRIFQGIRDFAKSSDTTSYFPENLEQKWESNRHRNPMITLYNDNMLELQTRWRKEIENRDTTIYTRVSKTNKSYANYQYPQFLSDGSIVAYKTGFDTFGKIVQISAGKEQEIYTPGHLMSALQSTGDFVYWVESVPNIRWQEKAKYVLCTLHIPTKKITRSIFKNSFHTPTISTDRKFVAVVERTPNGENRLLVFEHETGKTKYSLNMGDTTIYNPQFVSDSTIACIFRKKGVGITLLHLSEKKQEIIVQERNVSLKDLFYNSGNLFFTASYTGTNEIYCYSLLNKELKQLTQARYGASQPNATDSILSYANYTVKGSEIVKKAMNEIVQKRVSPKDWKDDFLLEGIKHQELCEGELPIQNQVFISKPYKKWKHLFNFHSRSPFAISEIEHKTIDFGVSTTSQNLLSTMFLNIGFRKKNAYKYGQVYTNMVYKGWFPIMATELSLGKQERRLLTLLNKIDTAVIKENKLRWEWKTRISLPFNISRGKYSRHFSANTTLEFAKDTRVKQSYLYGTDENSSFHSGSPVSLDFEKTNTLLKHDIVFSNLQKKAYRDLYSPFGQQLFLTYKHTPFARQHLFSYAAEGVLFLPTPLPHNGIRLYGGYNYQSSANGLLQTEIEHPRGTTAVLAKKKYTLMTDYAFPLAYPDWNLGRVLYVKRLTANVFYDFGISKTLSFSKQAYSYGVESRADMHFLQIPVPISAGVRIGWESQQKKPFYNFLFSWGF